MVAFEGEQAMDANPLSEAGVRREFFMLLLQAIEKPNILKISNRIVRIKNYMNKMRWP